jgi:hypothetical protein
MIYVRQSTSGIFLRHFLSSLERICRRIWIDPQNVYGGLGRCARTAYSDGAPTFIPLGPSSSRTRWTHARRTVRSGWSGASRRPLEESFLGGAKLPGPASLIVVGGPVPAVALNAELQAGVHHEPPPAPPSAVAGAPSGLRIRTSRFTGVAFANMSR